MTGAGLAGFRLLRLDTAPLTTSAWPATIAPVAGVAQVATNAPVSTNAPAATNASAATNALAATRAPTAGSAPPAPAAGATSAGAPAWPSPFAVAELLVPAGSPIFAGHFPGRPLLPGIAHLALVRLVLGELAARGALPGDLAGNTAIAEVGKLRLRRTVTPGDRLELRLLSADAAGAIRFELRRQPDGGADGPAQPDGQVRPDRQVQQNELASEGTVRIGTGRPPDRGPALAQGLPGAAGLPPVSALLPHAPPSRLLAAVLAASASGIVCAGVIPGTHPLVERGEAPGFLAIELAAQAAAVLQALQRSPAGGPRIGYLVGVRGAHLPTGLPIGQALRVTAASTGGAGALATYDMEVSAEDGDKRLATGAISTFLPEPE